MKSLFIGRVRGIWVLAAFAAPIVWALAAFQGSGLWPALGAAQGAADEPFWLQTTSFFTAEQASAAYANLRAAGAEATAYATHALDAVYIVLNTVAIAALIGFGVRRLGWAGSAASGLVYVPLAYFAADTVETSGLALGLASGADGAGAVMRAASVAGGVKTYAYLGAVGLGLILAGIGLIVWLIGRLRRADA